MIPHAWGYLQEKFNVAKQQKPQHFDSGDINPNRFIFVPQDQRNLVVFDVGCSKDCASSKKNRIQWIYADECEYYQRQCFEFTWDSVLCLSMTCVWVDMLNCKKYQLKQILVEAWQNSYWSTISLLQRKHFLLHCCCLLLEGKEGFCINRFYLFSSSQNVSKLFNFH